MPDPTALVIGIVAGGVGAFGLPGRRDVLGPLELGAIVLVVFGAATDVTTALVGLAVLVIVLSAHVEVGAPVRVGALVGAAVLVGADRLDTADQWLGVAAGVAVLVLAALAVPGVRAFGGPGTGWLLAWIPLAAYAAVPDTEEVTAVGAALMVGWLGTHVGRTLRPVDLHAAAVVIAWSVMTGARAREPSFVVIGAAVALLAAPVLVLVGRRIEWRSAIGAVVIVVHATAGLLLARHAGLGTDLSTAVGRAVAIVAGGIAVIVGLALVPRGGDQSDNPTG